jgi:hypothetical protein
MAYDAATQRARRAANPERARANERAYRERHREERRIASNERYHANPEYFAKYSRRRILRGYGLTEESYEALLVRQDRACAICRKPFPTAPHPHIDHDHDTGIVRGLLCGPCNQAIGLLGHDRERLLAASEYLRETAHALRNE